MQEQAFELGVITEALTHCKAADAACQSSLLARATSLLGAEQRLSTVQLQEAHAYMVEAQRNAGLVARIWGAMHFVNFMWLVGTIGLLATVGPCTAVLLHKLGLLRFAGHLLTLLWELASKAGVFLFRYTSTLWCPALYALVASGYGHGLRTHALQPDSPGGTYIALLALGLHAAISALHFTVVPAVDNSATANALLIQLRRCRRSARAPSRNGDRDAMQPDVDEKEFVVSCWTNALSSYTIIVCAVAAYALQSRLFGFAAVAAMFAWLGFFVLPFGLGEPAALISAIAQRCAPADRDDRVPYPCRRFSLQAGSSASAMPPAQRAAHWPVQPSRSSCWQCARRRSAAAPASHLPPATCATHS